MERKKQFAKPKHSEANDLNDLICQVISKVRKAIIECRFKGNTLTFESLKSLFEIEQTKTHLLNLVDS